MENKVKYKVIGWVNYDNGIYPPTEYSRAAELAVIEEIRAKGYRIDARAHQFYHRCCPVLNDGTAYYCGQREWGGIMAEALDIDDSDGMAYLEWFLPARGNRRRRLVIPPKGVDRSQIVPISQIDTAVPEEKKKKYVTREFKEREGIKIEIGIFPAAEEAFQLFIDDGKPIAYISRGFGEKESIPFSVRCFTSELLTITSSWEHEMIDEHALDGTSYYVKIEKDRKISEYYGQNKFPENYQEFLRLLRKYDLC